MMPDASLILQVFFLLSSATLLLVNNIPAFRSRFVTYGPRATLVVKKENESDGGDAHKPIHDVRNSEAIQHVERHEQQHDGTFDRILDGLATLQVPHAYFKHFYIASLLSSVFWALVLLLNKPVIHALCEGASSADPGRSMSIDQIALTWFLMAIQGIRRFVESSLFTKPSASKMWFVHWLLGMTFYASMGVAVWIEGAGALLTTESVSSSITFSAPSLKTIVGLPIFILASGIQHDCHAYLASLPKYTLPVHPIFVDIVCPHYTMECLIYFSLAVVAAPRGAIFNKTIFSALAFVTTNLAVTASTSKDWYERKFGQEAVAHRWKMFPLLH